MKHERSGMTLSDHVCKAWMIYVPGRAGVLSPVGLRGFALVFVLFNFLVYMAFVKSCH